jgi:hypothetical protein
MKSRNREPRHRFTRKYGLHIFIAIAVVAILAFVAFLMYALTSSNWRVRF